MAAGGARKARSAFFSLAFEGCSVRHCGSVFVTFTAPTGPSLVGRQWLSPPSPAPALIGELLGWTKFAFLAWGGVVGALPALWATPPNDRAANRLCLRSTMRASSCP